MIEIPRLKKLIIMFGYDESCSKILTSLMYEKDFVDVIYLTKKTSYSRSMVSLILKRLSENGVIIKNRDGHKYIYKLNEKFLINIYESFLNKIEKELKYISMDRKNFSENFYNQINSIKNNLKNIKGEAEWLK
ncbi:MAG: hypothetical protein ACP5R3_05935 [Thermoplasmata archaeon]|nr:hypothetical protein [Thermoplasmata archaeon]